MNRMRKLGDIRILFCADTHLGFDEPVRPRVERRRRGPDFFENFQRVLDDARDRRVDLLVHGGDLFFRSRVPPTIVDRVYRMLLGLAGHGIPILIVPGNHERSVLPSSLFLSHPNIHVFSRPETRVLDLKGTRVAVTGIPCERDDVRRQFRPMLDMTGWADVDCDARFLCLHQAIEGARVGPADFTFRSGHDVIRMADLPSEFDAVLAGHIHRTQVLTHRRPDGTSMPVLYPGSIERTSFAEMREPKGYLDLTLSGTPGPGRRHLGFDFVPLPARPMHEVVLGPGLDDSSQARAFLKSQLALLDPHSVVRLRWADDVPFEARSAVTGSLLREVTPKTMNLTLGGAFFAAREKRPGHVGMNRSPHHSLLIDKVRRLSPEGPGVYVFRGDRDEIIYVGKAVNLQQRMLSHLRIDLLADASRHSRMVYEIRDFEVQTTASELLALLREDEMIKRYRPRFNVRQNEFLEYKYLELTMEEYPRLRMLDHEAVLGDRRVFGPYRDRYFIDDVLGLIRDHLGLRSCSATVPVDRCIEFDLGHCAGPCRDAISPGQYGQVVARVVAFLDGDVDEVAARLTEAMESASERLEYEKAHELKERLGFCNRFGERQRFLTAFRDRRLIVVEEAAGAAGRAAAAADRAVSTAGRAAHAADRAALAADRAALADPSTRTYVFQRGRLTGAEGASAGAGDQDMFGDDPRFLLDRAAIVHRWLLRNSGRCRYSFEDLLGMA